MPCNSGGGFGGSQRGALEESEVALTQKDRVDVLDGAVRLLDGAQRHHQCVHELSEVVFEESMPIQHNLLNSLDCRSVGNHTVRYDWNLGASWFETDCMKSEALDVSRVDVLFVSVSLLMIHDPCRPVAFHILLP